MSNTIRLRTLLRFTIAFSYWLQVHHLVRALNVTVNDTDSSIVYEPSPWWFASTDLCSGCLDPGLSTTFHEGVHPFVANGRDPDDTNTTSSSSPLRTTAPAPAASPSPTSTGEAPEGSPGDPERHKGNGSDSTRRGLSRVLRKRLDPDDIPGLANASVTMTFNFTGSAIFLFATLPPTLQNINDTSSSMNISVLIDNVASPTLPVSTSSSYQPGQLVFSESQLSEGPHQLVVQVAENSTFIFEQLIYTTSTAVQPSSSPQPTASLSEADSKKQKKHNVETFAAAVGGSAGVLALFSLGLALSIIRRRHLAAKRERRDHESLHTNASDDSPEMAGPAPFVPRYFPDTVIPTEPPTYMTALATNHNNSTLLAVLPPAAFGTTARSYADIPPSTPPPRIEEPFLAAPPPFPLESPPPPPAAGSRGNEGETDDADAEGARQPSISGAELHSHHSATVGAEPSITAPAAERVPLLHSVPPSARPRSRASAHSALSYVTPPVSSAGSVESETETEQDSEHAPSTHHLSPREAGAP